MCGVVIAKGRRPLVGLRIDGFGVGISFFHNRNAKFQLQDRFFPTNTSVVHAALGWLAFPKQDGNRVHCLPFVGACCAHLKFFLAGNLRCWLGRQVSIWLTLPLPSFPSKAPAELFCLSLQVGQLGSIQRWSSRRNRQVQREMGRRRVGQRQHSAGCHCESARSCLLALAAFYLRLAPESP